MANTFVSLRRLQQFYNGLKNKFALKSDIKTPDWNAQAITDETSGETTYEDGYIENKPAIKAGEGEFSIESVNHDAKEYRINITVPTEETDTISFEPIDDISDIGSSNIPLKLHITYTYENISSGEQSTGIKVFNIKSIDKSNFIIVILQDTVSFNLQKYTYSNFDCRIWKSKTVAIGSDSIALSCGESSVVVHDGGIAIMGGLSRNKGIAIGRRALATSLGSIAIGSEAHTGSAYAIAQGYHSNAVGASSVAMGYKVMSSGLYSNSQNRFTIAYGTASHAEGASTKAYGYASHSEGIFTISANYGSHTEGCTSYYEIKLTGEANATIYTYSDDSSEYIQAIYDRYNNNQIRLSTVSSEKSVKSLDELPIVTNIDLSAKTVTVDQTISENSLDNSNIYFNICTRADGNGSHAEGISSRATGAGSHSEGKYSSADGEGSHAEGRHTKATGSDSHAEGTSTVANGDASHAQGVGTIAAKHTQFTLGTYNIEDDGTSTHPHDESYGQYAVILGNGGGTDSRSNAHTIDWTGKGWFANTVSAGTIETPATVVNANDLTTKAYVDSAIANAVTEERVNALIAAAFAQYGDGDIASYGFINVNEEAY